MFQEEHVCEALYEASLLRENALLQLLPFLDLKAIVQLIGILGDLGDLRTRKRNALGDFTVILDSGLSTELFARISLKFFGIVNIIAPISIVNAGAVLISFA